MFLSLKRLWLVLCRMCVTTNWLSSLSLPLSMVLFGYVALVKKTNQVPILETTNDEIRSIRLVRGEEFRGGGGLHAQIE